VLDNCFIVNSEVLLWMVDLHTLANASGG